MRFSGNRMFNVLVCLINRKYSSQCTNSILHSKRIDSLKKMAFAKSRADPVVMTLDSPEFKAIFTEELKTLMTLFDKYNHEIRIAGGAVRDLLSGKQPHDLDFATTATPTEMKEMFTTENVRMINDNGEKHGTITPRINDKENYEITTLRIDVVTDGRRAEVQFTRDWLLDAMRRDLTINSMFLGFDGTVYDYFYGYDDLKKCRIAFVGDASTRIQEDYLRILRYFRQQNLKPPDISSDCPSKSVFLTRLVNRFYGRIAKEPNQHEEETLKVIKENAEGLAQISGERIWTELKKIAEGKYAGELIITIIECGLAEYLGLPKEPDVEELKIVWKRSGHLKLHGLTLLASLLRTQNEVVDLNNRLKFSAYERELLFFILEHRRAKLHEKPLMPYQQLVLKTIFKPANVKEWAVEVLKYNNSPHLEELQNWTIPKFPLKGNVLVDHGVERGRFLGNVMTELKHYWADNNFNLNEEDILKELPNVLEKLRQRKK